MLICASLRPSFAASVYFKEAGKQSSVQTAVAPGPTWTATSGAKSDLVITFILLPLSLCLQLLLLLLAAKRLLPCHIVSTVYRRPRCTDPTYRNVCCTYAKVGFSRIWCGRDAFVIGVSIIGTKKPWAQRWLLLKPLLSSGLYLHMAAIFL